MTDQEDTARLPTKPEVARASAVKQLTAEIKSELTMAYQAGLTMVKHAQRVGELLIELKERLPRGQYTPHVKKHFGLSKQSSAGYVRLYEHRDEIDEGMPLRQALKAISTPRETSGSSALGRSKGQHVVPNPATEAELREIAARPLVTLGQEQIELADLGAAARRQVEQAIIAPLVEQAIEPLVEPEPAPAVEPAPMTGAPWEGKTCPEDLDDLEAALETVAEFCDHGPIPLPLDLATVQRLAAITETASIVVNGLEEALDGLTHELGERDPVLSAAFVSEAGEWEDHTYGDNLVVWYASNAPEPETAEEALARRVEDAMGDATQKSFAGRLGITVATLRKILARKPVSAETREEVEAFLRAPQDGPEPKGQDDAAPAPAAAPAAAQKRQATRVVDPAEADSAALAAAIKTWLEAGGTAAELLEKAKAKSRAGERITTEVDDLLQGKVKVIPNYHMRDALWHAVGGRPSA